VKLTDLNIIITEELTNLTIVYWCGDRSRLRGTIDCCTALLTDLIEGIGTHWNVTHETNNEGVLLSVNED
jgi:hypothetical protein